MNTSKFFTLEIWCYREDLGEDVSYWSHGSHNLNLLKKFVEGLVISYPSDCGRMSIQKLIIKKYEVNHKSNSKLHMLSGPIYYSSTIDDPLYLSHTANDFFTVNLHLNRFKYSKTKKQEISTKKDVDASFVELWKKVDEKLGK